MLFAVLGALNGDIEALKQALEFLEGEGILVTLQSGNIAVGGDSPNEVVRLLEERGIPCVQGEQDRELVRFSRKPQSWRTRWDAATLERMSRAQEAITGKHLEWLSALPRRRHLQLEEKTICLCHGSPASQAEPIAQNLPAQKFDRLREMEPVDVLVCGGADTTFSVPVAHSLICGIGPLRQENGQLQLGIISTEEEEALLSVVLIN